MSKLIITCKEATRMVSQKEEELLSSYDYIRLQLHLIYCRVCRLFEKQTAMIARASKDLTTSHKLMESDKEAIRQTLKAT